MVLNPTSIKLTTATIHNFPPLHSHSIGFRLAYFCFEKTAVSFNKSYCYQFQKVNNHSLNEWRNNCIQKREIYQTMTPILSSQIFTGKITFSAIIILGRELRTKSAVIPHELYILHILFNERWSNNFLYHIGRAVEN